MTILNEVINLTFLKMSQRETCFCCPPKAHNVDEGTQNVGWVTCCPPDEGPQCRAPYVFLLPTIYRMATCFCCPANRFQRLKIRDDKSNKLDLQDHLHLPSKRLPLNFSPFLAWCVMPIFA